MPQFHPPAETLLETARSYLRDSLLSDLPREHQYPVRIVASLLGIVQRQLAEGPGAEAEEKEALRRLLDEDGELQQLRASLAEALRKGRMVPENPDLVATLRKDAAAALSINNPRWLEDADNSGKGR